MQDDLDAELEALEAVYDEQVQLVCRWPLSLRLRLLPSTCGDATLRFVKATLWIEADDEYPRTRPELHICDAKGLGDHRASRLLSR
jgi:E3 ubiquitin-protein ligase RNF25